MIGESFFVESQKDSFISMEVTPGHFSTSNSHVSHYLNLSALMTNARMARDVAVELAVPYLDRYEEIDTIVCMEGTEMIGAFLAQALLEAAGMGSGDEKTFYVLTPMHAHNRQLFFPKNDHVRIVDKNIILLVASASSGKTVENAMECLAYYGGNLIGISALFSGVPEMGGQEITSLFTPADVPGYHTALPAHCQMCKENQALDAIIYDRGYTGL